MIWSLIGSIGGKVLDIVDNVVEDKDEANRLKVLLQRKFSHSSSNWEASEADFALASFGDFVRRDKVIFEDL